MLLISRFEGGMPVPVTLCHQKIGVARFFMENGYTPDDVRTFEWDESHDDYVDVFTGRERYRVERVPVYD